MLFGIRGGLCGNFGHFFRRFAESNRFGLDLFRLLYSASLRVLRRHLADLAFGKFHFADVEMTKLVRAFAR